MNLPDLRIRPAEPHDAHDYVAAHVAAQIATYAPIMPQDYAASRRAEAPAAARALEAELTEMQAALAAGREPFRRHWVAERDTAEHARIIGIACAGSGPNWWEAGFDPPPIDIPFMLDRLYVVPAEHGTGAGQALFDRAVGARSAYLWILRSNPRAERFYRRNGFVPDGAVGPAGGPWLGRPMFRMVRRLPVV